MPDPVLAIALDLAASLPARDRYDRLLAAVRRVVPADAATLLGLEEDRLKVLASAGLAPEALERRFDPGEHPRLAAILAAPGPVRFPVDDPLPDPFDGLVVGAPSGSPGVHDCMGCPLRVEGELIGALTLDALAPGAFDVVDDGRVATFAALAAVALRTAATLEALEEANAQRGEVSRSLVARALEREGGEILGRSPAIEALRAEIDRVATSDLTVLLTGETGTGKDLVARTIHARSRRADQPLVDVNCAALPESIAESELFGHVRGSFTGAVADRPGRLELAHRGTLFLDEIGELPLSLQPLLLRALQQGEIQRVGADRVRRVDVRVIAATNRDLAAQVREGRFRADLYHRLAVYPIHLPPLRERGDDVLLLAGWFLDRARVRLGTGPVRLAPQARDALLGADWPGNVRELEHVLLRAVLRARTGARGEAVLVLREHLDLGALPPEIPAPPVPAPSMGTPLNAALDAFQRRLVADTVAACGGNWAEAARRLGVDRGNLHRLARRLGIKPAPSRAPHPAPTRPP